jgi:hypothetical protein
MYCNQFISQSSVSPIIRAGNIDFGCLRRNSGPKREEVIGGWRTLHNEALHNL